MQQPDAATIEELLAHRDWVRALARSLVADRNRADDLEQEAWVRALRRPPAHGGSLRSWFARVLRNAMVDSHRRAAHGAQREADVARPERMDAAPVDVVARAELETSLARAVLDVAEPYRTVLLLRWFEDRSPAEIAARLGVPLETVRTRLRRGLEQLRERLDRESGGDRERWRLALLPVVVSPRAPAPVVPLAGVLAMSAKKTLAVVVALVLVAAVGSGVVLLRGRGARGAREHASVVLPPQSAADTATRTRSPSAAGVELAAPNAADLPPPVDLDKADRDLDLHGVVVDGAGRPVAGATLGAYELPWLRIGIFYVGDDRVAPGPSTRSAADGTFALRLARGDDVHLRVTAAGFATVDLANCQAGQRLRVVLTPGVAVVVVATGERGEPVPGVRVALEGDSPSMARRAFRLHHAAVTGPDGIARIDALPGDSSGTLSIEHDSLDAIDGGALMVHLPPAGEFVVRRTMAAGSTIRGRVTDAATGDPIAGARVSTSWTMRRPVTTRADGTYVLPYWRGAIHVMATADGYARETTRIGVDEVIDVRLRRGAQLVGRLVGADGSPVVGARLAAKWGDGESISVAHAESAADGAFDLRDLRAGAPHILVAAGAGFGRFLLDVDTPAEPGGTRDLGDLVVPPARSIAGRVLLPDGSAAADAEVRLSGSNDDRARLRDGRRGYESSAHRESRRTDDLGRFRFAGLAPGTYRAEAIVVGRMPVIADIALADRDVEDVAIRLGGGEPFVVTVKDANGQPLACVTVSVVLEGGAGLSSTTLGDGRITYFSESRVVTVNTLPWPGPRRFFHPPARAVRADEREVTVTLDEAAVIEGVVLGLDGRPLPQATLDVLRDGRPLWQAGSVAKEAWADLRGRFEVLVPPEGAVDLVLTGFAYFRDASAPAGFFEGSVRGVAPGTRGVVLRAEPLAQDRSLRVRVLGPDGDPQPGAEVRAWVLGQTVPAVYATRTGTAHLLGLPPRPVHLVARLPSGHPDEGNWVDAVVSDVVPEGQEVELRFAEGVRVAGVVLGADGRPVEGARVEIYAPPRKLVERTTDARGRFAFAVPSAQKEALYVFAWSRAPDGAYAEFRDESFRPGGEDVTIRLADR